MPQTVPRRLGTNTEMSQDQEIAEILLIIITKVSVSCLSLETSIITEMIRYK